MSLSQSVSRKVAHKMTKPILVIL